MDECNGTNVCNAENGTCTNAIGSYTCMCKDGFTGKGSVCDSTFSRVDFFNQGVTFSFLYVSDVNECATGEHDCHPNAFCIDIAGSWVCSCLSGFTGNGTFCTGEFFANAFGTSFHMYIHILSVILSFCLFVRL